MQQHQFDLADPGLPNVSACKPSWERRRPRRRIRAFAIGNLKDCAYNPLAARTKAGPDAAPSSFSGNTSHENWPNGVWANRAKGCGGYAALETQFDLAKALIAARTKAGLTQEEVAERMKTSQSFIARLEAEASLQRGSLFGVGLKQLSSNRNQTFNPCRMHCTVESYLLNCRCTISAVVVEAFWKMGAGT